ncbi:MAG TPA: MarR family transcriptional regulator [Gammaproteobacteria bacterium]|jgi:DNA-binding MarR family transcriptional regulator
MNATASKATRHQAVFVTALRDFESASREILREHKVTPKQYRAMLVIGTADTDHYLNMNALADKVGVRHNSAVGLINRLERAGLVQRLRTPADRRVASLSLTEKGAEALEQLADAHNQNLKRVSPEIHGALAAAA